MSTLPTLALFSSLAGPDMFILAGIALLVFGGRLPEVGKNLGRSIVEFKKGLNGDGSIADDRDGDDEPPVKTPKRTVSQLKASSPSRATTKSLPPSNDSEEV